MMRVHVFTSASILIVLVALVGTLAGCSTILPSSRSQFSDQPFVLQLKGSLGQVDRTAYHSKSRLVTAEGSQTTREKDEEVEFSVEEKVESIGEGGLIAIKATTVKKDGVVPLHDLGFPELKDEIQYRFHPQGQVLEAGPYPKSSLFFIPPVPLPPGPVSVGDTWELRHAWISMKTGIPMSLNVVTIFKGVVSCGTVGGRCADLELSGAAEILGLGPMPPGVGFESQIWGRILFSIERGGVVWSEMRSREKMTMPDGRTDVLSCMRSVLVESSGKPQSWRPSQARGTQCEPKEEVVRLD